MSTRLIVGQTYRVKPEFWSPCMEGFCGVTEETTIVLRKIESDGIHIFDVSNGSIICLEERKVFWYDEKSAMREIPKADNGTRPNLLAVDESWLLPAGTFFRVANKHTPLYMVMSNSHVFNLTEKQMHTTNSLRFKDKQLVEANVSLTEVL